MTRSDAAGRRPLVVPFWALAGVVAAVCAGMVRTPLYQRAPEMAAYGVTFDLCLTIPALYYFLVVRRGAHPATLIPVFGAGMLAARLLVPSGHREFLHALAPLGSVLELVLVGLVFSRARRTSRTLRAEASAGPAEKIRLAVEGIFGRGRLAGFLAAEITILWFALFSWRRRREEEGTTFYRASGWGTVLAGLLVLIAGEGLGAHLLLASWSARAAWTFTALDVYGVLWLLGDFQALRLLPTTFDGRTLRLRLGMRWSGEVDARNVTSVSRLAPGEFRKSRDTLRFSVLDEPRYAITFREPVPFRGIAGLERRVRIVALLPDDPAAFEALFSAFPA